MQGRRHQYGHALGFLVEASVTLHVVGEPPFMCVRQFLDGDRPRGAENQIVSAGAADPGRKDTQTFGLRPKSCDLVTLRIEIESDQVASLIFAEEGSDRVLSFQLSYGG